MANPGKLFPKPTFGISKAGRLLMRMLEDTTITTTGQEYVKIDEI